MQIMFYTFPLILLVTTGSYGQQQEAKPKSPPPNPAEPTRPVFFYDGFQNAPLHYGVAILEPRQQLFPRLQPQLLIYPGGAPPGQQFLLHPGAPPGNFLVPQPQPQPQPRPDVGELPPGVFVARYPKPTHVPPIEKDAEEIPTDPSKVPKFPTSTRSNKPEKLETFNDSKDERATEDQDVNQSTPDKNPNFLLKKTSDKLKPGQRFFILNGQPLFANYPHQLQLDAAQELATNARYGQGFAHQFHDADTAQAPVQDLFLRNSVTGQITDVNGQYPQEQLQNYVSLNQPQDFKDSSFFLKDAVPLNVFQQFKEPAGLFGAEKVEEGYAQKGFPLEHLAQIPQYGLFHGTPEAHAPLGYYQYANKQTENQELDDTVVIDAKVQKGRREQQPQAPEGGDEIQEPSISQAQPGAIALAGPGGVASADPRGTALVGERGLAVSSPQATAVAGPSKDREMEQKRRKLNRKEKQ